MYANNEITTHPVTTEIKADETTKKSVLQHVGKAILTAFAAFGLSIMGSYGFEANESFHYNYQNLN